MKKKYLLLSLPLIMLGLAFAQPAIAVVQCNDGADNDADGKTDTFDSDCESATDTTEGVAAVPPETKDLSFSINNPLDSDIDTLPEFINKIVEIFLMVGTPIVALMIIYAGFLFVIARGNPEAIEKAKKTLGFTLLGAAILLGAFVISTAIQDTIMSISDEGTE